MLTAPAGRQSSAFLHRVGAAVVVVVVIIGFRWLPRVVNIPRRFLRQVLTIRSNSPRRAEPTLPRLRIVPPRVSASLRAFQEGERVATGLENLGRS
jgi:hypothetical protein